MQRKDVFALLGSVVAIATANIAKSATFPTGFTESLIASSISSPTAMEFAPDGRLFILRQAGVIRIVKNNVLLPNSFLSMTVNSTGERGLLGIAFDPDFANNNYLYLYYTTNTAPIHNRVSRFTANGDVVVPGSEVILADIDNLSSATNHNGGAIHFGKDGKLYIAVGDNATSSNSQTLNNRLGKMLRINKEGTIPTDNPFYNTATGNNRMIWAWGLRNPFNFAFQPETGRLFINDVGLSTWEEINEGVAGANYGWPTTEGPTTNPNFLSPLHAYGHNGDADSTGCSIIGGAFYNPAVQMFPNAYLNTYFFADYCNNWIRRLDTNNNNQPLAFATGTSSPVDLKVASDGALWYLQRGNTGRIYRVTYATQITGRVTLEGCESMNGIQINFTFRPHTGNSFQKSATINANGDFTLSSIPVGNYNVLVQGSKWLAKNIAINTSNGNVSGVLASLVGGDSNNDNFVDVLDYDVLLQAFGTVKNVDPAYNEMADFNCDNAVDILDAAILFEQFGAIGDL